MPARDPKLVAGLAFVLLSFAANSLMTRHVVAGNLLDPALLSAIRFLAGALALAGLMAVKGRLAEARPHRRHIVPVFWLAAYAFLISYAYVHIGAAAGTFVFYAFVLATMTGLGAWHEGRAPPARSMAGGLLALAGVGALAIGRVELVTPLGVILIAGTGIAWGAYSMLGRRHGDALAFTAGNFLLLGLLLIIPTGLFASGFGGAVRLTTEGVVWATAMGAGTTAFAYAVWYWALPRIGATQAGTYQLLIPVLAAAGAVALLGERFSLKLILAGSLVVAGMWLATPRARPAAPVAVAGSPPESS